MVSEGLWNRRLFVLPLLSNHGLSHEKKRDLYYVYYYQRGRRGAYWPTIRFMLSMGVERQSRAKWPRFNQL